MKNDKEKLKQIWRLARVIGIGVFFLLIPVFISVGAEWIAAFILSAVSAVVSWYAMILVLVRIMLPGLDEFVNNARVERVHDDIEVESSIRETGDTEFDDYVRDYARARDFWGKTGMLLLVGIFMGLLYFIFGVP